MDKWINKDNQIILNPNEDNERNLTEECSECEFCKYNVDTCKGNKEGCYCDWFTIKDGYEEIFEDE